MAPTVSAQFAFSPMSFLSSGHSMPACPLLRLAALQEQLPLPKLNTSVSLAIRPWPQATTHTSYSCTATTRQQQRPLLQHLLQQQQQPSYKPLPAQVAYSSC